MAVERRCPCGAAYTLRAWERLRFLGVQEGKKYALELRLFAECGSTMSRPIRQEKRP